MARIIVVGSGFAGLSAAARLAKLRHDVTVLERAPEPGGRLLGVPIGDSRWAPAPDSVTLPGVFRDLFRKSGRTMDALIDLTTIGPRHHVLPGRWPRRGVAFDLPFGTRGAQHHALLDAVGADAWSPWLDELNEPWNVLRRTILEVVHEESSAPELPLGPISLDRFARGLRDSRLRRLAADVGGVDPVSAPAVLAVWHYVERNFGRWRFEGGNAGLAAALVTRLGERKVTIETGVEVEPPTAGPVDGLVAGGEFRPADVVVWAAGADPLTAPPDSPRTLTAVRLAELALPEDFVVHDRAVVRGWRSGDGWVLEAPSGTDPLEVLARNGLDVRSAVTWTGTAPAGPAISELPRPARSPHPGLWLVGAAATPGATLELTGMGTAALATHLGAAPR